MRLFFPILSKGYIKQTRPIYGVNIHSQEVHLSKNVQDFTSIIRIKAAGFSFILHITRHMNDE